MLNRILTMAKPLALGVFAVAFLALAPSQARADEVFISGFTNGCFGAGCAPGSTSSFLGLTYSNSTFAGTTANGFRALGGNPNPGANLNNLGSFTLSTAPNDYTGQSFTLTTEGGATHSGRIYAVLTRGATSAALYFTDMQDSATNTPVVYNVRARKSGDRLTLSPAPQTQAKLTFAPARGRR